LAFFLVNIGIFQIGFLIGFFIFLGVELYYNKIEKIEKFPKSGHSALIEACIDADRSRKKWATFNVTWSNDTSAHIIGTANVGDSIVKTDTVYTHLPTIEAASAYFDQLKPRYPALPKAITQQAAPYDVTRHEPSVIKGLKSTDNSRYLTQQDVLITQKWFQEVFHYPKR
jgi:hypothetical protein